jgi:hypothetical protein
MKLSAKLFLIFALCFISSAAVSQTVVNTINNIKWSLIPQWPEAQQIGASAYNSSGSLYSEGVATGLIKIDNNSIISPIQLDSKNYGVIRLNKDMSTQWQIKLDYFPLAIGVFHGKILVIATNEYSSWKGTANNFIGYVIDPATGNIITQKNIYTDNEDFFEQPVFLIAPDGSSFKMVMRISTLTKKAHFSLAFNSNKGVEELLESSDFKILDFNESLDLKSSIKPVLEDGLFMGATINKNGDVFLMTEYSQAYIKIARYEPGKTAPSKVLQLPISMSDDIGINLGDSYLFTSKTDPLILHYAMTYKNANNDRELAVGKFDFKKGIVDHDIQVMDKAYLKELRKSYVPFNKKFDDADLGSKNSMYIKNVIENNGKLIVALGSYSTYNTTSASPEVADTRAVFEMHDIIVNMYDEKANLQFQQLVSRIYRGYFPIFFSPGMHCKNDILYIDVNNNKGFYGYKTIYSQIDLKTGAILNIAGISKDNIKNSYPSSPIATLWFDDQFILSYMEEKGFIKDTSADAHLQLINY